MENKLHSAFQGNILPEYLFRNDVEQILFTPPAAHLRLTEFKFLFFRFMAF